MKELLKYVSMSIFLMSGNIFLDSHMSIISWEFVIFSMINITGMLLLDYAYKPYSDHIARGKDLTIMAGYYNIKRNYWKLEFIDFVFRKNLHKHLK